MVSAAPWDGTVYLLHFDRPYKHARHYIGWTLDLTARLAAHRAGQGSRLLHAVRAAGIGWTLARTWPGDRHRERQLKHQGGRARLCPVCRAAAGTQASLFDPSEGDPSS
jgi:predicted GIY-YIG superfamily endonuclease